MATYNFTAESHGAQHTNTHIDHTVLDYYFYHMCQQTIYTHSIWAMGPKIAKLTKSSLSQMTACQSTDIITGPVPFLSPNQQHQISERKVDIGNKQTTCKYERSYTVCLEYYIRLQKSTVNMHIPDSQQVNEAKMNSHAHLRHNDTVKKQCSAASRQQERTWWPGPTWIWPCVKMFASLTDSISVCYQSLRLYPLAQQHTTAHGFYWLLLLCIYVFTLVFYWLLLHCTYVLTLVCNRRTTNVVWWWWCSQQQWQSTGTNNFPFPSSQL